MRSLLITSLAALAMVCSARQGAPSDVPAGHWARSAVDALYRAGILVGYPNGKFSGDRAISRYEMATALSNISDSELRTSLPQAQDRSSELATKNDFADLTRRVAALRLQVDALHGDVTGIRTATQEMRSQLDSLRQQIGQMKRDLNSSRKSG